VGLIITGSVIGPRWTSQAGRFTPACTIARAHETLTRSGVEHPRIGVCGINPHAGEHGLFGYGEEESKIEPAVRACRARGWDVQGPLPADTLFFRAGRGDFDIASIGFLLFGLFFVNCMTNNSREQLNREYSYPSIKQGPDAALHIAFTYFRQAIKYVRVAEAWVRG